MTHSANVLSIYLMMTEKLDTTNMLTSRDAEKLFGYSRSQWCTIYRRVGTVKPRFYKNQFWWTRAQLDEIYKTWKQIQKRDRVGRFASE